VRDHHFAELRNGKFKGRVAGTREVRGREKITVIDRSEKIIVIDHSEIIETIHCQGGHVAKGHHFANLQEGKVKSGRNENSRYMKFRCS
jgi:hypothetical protein